LQELIFSCKAKDPLGLKLSYKCFPLIMKPFIWNYYHALKDQYPEGESKDLAMGHLLHEQN